MVADSMSLISDQAICNTDARLHYPVFLYQRFYSAMPKHYDANYRSSLNIMHIFVVDN